MNELGDNGAHQAVGITVFVKSCTAIISAAKVRHCKRRLPDALFSPRECGGQQVMFFGIFHVLPLIRGDLLYLIRNIVRLLTEQNPGYRGLAIRDLFADRYARAKRVRHVKGKNSKKIPKKKRLTKNTI